MASAKKHFIQTHPFMWSPSPQVSTLDASGEKLAVTFCVEEGATLTHLFFRYGTRTGTPPTYKIGLQGVGADGLPDGTYKGGASPASATFTPPADTTWNTTGRWQLLDNSYAATRGEILAWVIEYSTGTIDVTNNSSFAHQQDYGSRPTPMFPVALTHNGTSWSKQGSWFPLWGYKSSSNVYGDPIVRTATNQITTSGHRSASKFALDSGWADTFKIRGFSRHIEIGTGSVKLGIWNAAGTELDALTLDSDLGNLNSQRLLTGFFSDTLDTLSYGTTYYIGYEHIGTSFWEMYVQLSEANDLLAYPGEGQFGRSTWNGSAWADDVDAFFQAQLRYEDITEPVGGAGTVNLLRGKIG